MNRETGSEHVSRAAAALEKPLGSRSVSLTRAFLPPSEVMQNLECGPLFPQLQDVSATDHKWDYLSAVRLSQPSTDVGLSGMTTLLVL